MLTVIALYWVSLKLNKFPPLVLSFLMCFKTTQNDILWLSFFSPFFCLLDDLAEMSKCLGGNVGIFCSNGHTLSCRARALHEAKRRWRARSLPRALLPHPPELYALKNAPFCQQLNGFFLDSAQCLWLLISMLKRKRRRRRR